MSTSPVPARHLVWSIGAVLAGLIANIVLSLGTDVTLHATGVYPAWFQPMSDPLWALALAYRALFAFASGHLTARLAPRAPMTHTGVLIGIGVLLGLIGVGANWNKGPEFGPHWYGVGIIVVSAPCTWLGGVLACARPRRGA